MSDVALSGPLAYVREKPVDTDAQRKSLRQRLFIVFGALLAVAAIAGGGWWLVIGQRYISTDDAYVAADSAEVTPQINATISDVPVTDTMHVRRGQVLVRLDAADSEIAYAQAQANYAQATRHVHQYFSNADEAAAQVEARSSDLQRATLDYNRRVVLAKGGWISQEQLSTYKNTFETARAGLAAAQQARDSQQALVTGTGVGNNPEVLAAKAALDKARLDLSRTVIRAPFDGVIAQRAAQLGERVQVGQTLMTVVPVDRAYVDANFKEGQLTRVHPGQSVTLTSDLYGSGVAFHGRVQGLSGGTGAAFSLIPAQNATGNWIKVVQRLPVRVDLDRRELAQHPLQVGLSMNATIDASQ
jgi:membrane fusion protein (multidrug efflux system)